MGLNVNSTAFQITDLCLIFTQLLFSDKYNVVNYTAMEVLRGLFFSFWQRSDY